MTLRQGHFVLDADVTECLDIEFRCGNPTEPFAKGVVRIHHIPMAGGVGHGDGALGPVVVPLRHLNKGQDSKRTPSTLATMTAFTFLNILGGVRGGSLVGRLTGFSSC